MDFDRQALLHTFASESEEQLGAMDAGLQALAARPGDREVARSLYRLVHTIEGSAATVELEELTTLAHSMKAALDAVRGGRAVADEAVVSVLVEGKEALRAALGRVSNPGTPPDQSGLLRRLDHIASGAQQATSVPGNGDC
jgi:two-component system chemotaxis sensor kinase CheA